MRHRERGSDDATRARKVVEQTTWSPIRCVDRAQETCEDFNERKSSSSGTTLPHASGSNFRTVVVLSSAKKAPRWIHRKWLIYRCQFSFSATIVNPDACCRSRPVGDTRFPVARKLANRAPISKFMRAKTLWTYRSSEGRQFRS
jgi:hypothetical protein